MNTPKDGGPAFPCHVPDLRGPDFEPIREGFTETGVTMRDYFAAQVDIPWNAVFETWRFIKGNADRIMGPTLEEIAEIRSSYKYIEADAMLKAREAKS